MSTVPALSAPNGELTTTQNGIVSINLGSVPGSNLVITSMPTRGRIVVEGTTVTYRSTDPLYTGKDTIKYRFVNGATSSNEATIVVNLTPIPAGTYSRIENYTGGDFSLAGWRSFSSTMGHTSSSLVETGPTGRRFKVQGDMAAYAGDAAYLARFGVLPVDGSGFGMKDWPWKADLLRLPECGVDATITVKINALNNQYPMAAVLINYDIENRELTGYQLLVNAGGGSLTLSRFNRADELATAYIDRWPNTNYGTEAMANPIVSGPYKGWNYKNGSWPAGGNIGVGSVKFVAVRYQYDVSTKVTKISYEARGANGVDATPGSWDQSVTLSGADSLTPGGSFGLMALNYHTQSMILPTDFEVPEFKLQCVLP